MRLAMKVICQDQQEPTSNINGAEFSRPEQVHDLFLQLRGRTPFMFELKGENGFKLLVGFSEECGCIQFSRADGAPPYLVAVSEDAPGTEEVVEFLAGGTPTPIQQRFCLPLSMVEDIVTMFVRDGTRSNMVSWEEI
jgi:hypothetical protein